MALAFVLLTVNIVSGNIPNFREPCACTMEYLPVCCENDRTYGNGCSAFCQDGQTNCDAGACGSLEISSVTGTSQISIQSPSS